MTFSLPDDASLSELVAAGIVSRESRPDFEAYGELLLHWQGRINLIGASTIKHLWSRHVADSLQLLDHLGPDPIVIADLGSGAGFPGLVLAIALKGRPGAFVHLIESNGKKAAFLREAVRITEAPAEVVQARIESLDSEALQPQPAIVTARALAPLSELLDLSEKWLQKGATGLFLKGQDVDSELTETSKYWIIRAEKAPSRLAGGGVILKVEEVSRDTRSTRR